MSPWQPNTFKVEYLVKIPSVSNYFGTLKLSLLRFILKGSELLKVESINAMLEETGIYFTFYKLCVYIFKICKDNIITNMDSFLDVFE